MENKDVISINNLSKSYNNIDVLKNININIQSGDFISIVGNSGCGKSTLLNIIAKLDTDYYGNIKYYSNCSDNIGYMMQDPALFPWLTIKKNALLASKIKQIHNDDFIMNLLKKYNIYDFKDKYPKDLSGGMKQRVSLIRTISTKPKILLLDEPFSALDYQSRLSIGNDVYKLVRENSITTILITHDIAEAISLSDKVIVLTKRPATIKNVYNIDIDKKIRPTMRRKDNKFSYYFNLIGEDLDLFEDKSSFY